MKKFYNKSKHHKFLYISLTTSIALLIFIFTYLGIYSSKAHSNISINLTEKQCILLCNYLYVEDICTSGTIKDQLNTYKTNGVYDSSLISARDSGLRNSDLIDIFKEIENDEFLSELTIVDYIDCSIRAVCFTPKANIGIDNAEAIIVFAGTKGLDSAWLDNFEGAYYTDTNMQLTAADFFDDCNKNYTISNVTGHSKGGNLAQYVTLTQGKDIKKCISFDGQGFSELFIKKYQSDINLYADKVKNISSYKEPVHALLNPLAGENVCINTNKDVSVATSHISSVLYNPSYFDENGNYLQSKYTNQSALINNVAKISSLFVEKIDDPHLKLCCEKCTPILCDVVVTFQNVVAEENVSKLKKFYTELKQRLDDGIITPDEYDTISK